MSYFFKLYGTALAAFLAIDGVWLTMAARGFYAKHLGYLMSPTPNLVAALVFYLLNIIGIVVLTVIPGLNEGSLQKTLLFAAIYGLCTYATYDLTNLATIKDWPLLVTIVDLIWGTTLTTAIAWITFVVARRWF